jgi:hypothetical protein
MRERRGIGSSRARVYKGSALGAFLWIVWVVGWLPAMDETPVPSSMPPGRLTLNKRYQTKHDRKAVRQLLQQARDAALNFSEVKRDLIMRRWEDGWRIDVVDGRDVLTPPAPGTSPEIGERIPEAVLDHLQPLLVEFDPVIQMVIMGADWSNSPELRLRANGVSAEYLHPKLKSIELIDDGDTKELLDERNQLAARMVGILDAMATARRMKDATEVNPVVVDVEQANGNGAVHDDAALRAVIEDDEDDDDESGNDDVVG